MSTSSIPSTPRYISIDFQTFKLNPEYLVPKRSTSLISSVTDPIFNCLSEPLAWFQGPKPEIKTPFFRSEFKKPVCAIGDIHGELFGLIENLYDAGLIDDKCNWAEKDEILVQIGDVIDRGRLSEESWEYLSTIQEQAENSKGQVVRLIGNHELMLLQENYGYAAWVIEDPVSFREKVINDILNDKVHLAYSDGKRLYIHAGIRSKMRKQLIEEVVVKKRCSFEEVSVEDLVEHLNELLVAAVKENDFSHPIFQVGTSRGGENSVGGVVWEDITELLRSKSALKIPQVIGHNAPRNLLNAPIQITESQRLVNIDAGMNALYGGRRAYALFESKQVNLRIKNHALKKWLQGQGEDLIR